MLRTCFGTGRRYIRVGLQRKRPIFDAPETSPDHRALGAQLRPRKQQKEEKEEEEEEENEEKNRRKEKRTKLSG
jgi:hypothetical protein